MKRLHLATFVLVLLTAAARVAHADDTADDHIARATDAHARGDFEQTRDELLAAYKLDPRPYLLFALGQVELNLGHPKQAIDYYERFKATNPPADQLELTEQAIGAARLELQRPPKSGVPPTTPNQSTPALPLPPKPPPHREWDTFDTVIASAGGAAIIGGAIAIGIGLELPNETNTTLHTYERRVNDAYLSRDIGIASAASGALAVGGAFLRWRLHLVDTTITVEPTRTGVALRLERPL